VLRAGGFADAEAAAMPPLPSALVQAALEGELAGKVQR
jgi:hypothetical protein